MSDETKSSIPEEILQEIKAQGQAYEDHLVKALSPFSKQKADFVVVVQSGVDPLEPFGFFSALKDVLMDADWRDPADRPFTKTRYPDPFQPIFENGFLSTVEIEFRYSRASAKTKQAALALARGLNQAIPRSAFELANPIEPPTPFWPSRDDADTIVVSVGVKSSRLDERRNSP